MLRRFFLSGGMMVFNAGLGSKPFYDSARRELRRIFPELPIERLSAGHPVYHAYYELDRVSYCQGVREAGYAGDQPWLDGLTVSCRTVALVSRWGLAAGWEGKEDDAFRAYRAEDALRLGVNLFSYATAARAWVKGATSAATFTDRGASRSDRMCVAQVIHDGEWRTRYAALSILLHTFNQRTDVPVAFRAEAMRLTDPKLFNAPLLYLTGHETLALSREDNKALRRYLLNGGFLFAEACCGRRGFDRAFRDAIRNVLPGQALQPVPHDTALFRSPNRIERLSVTRSLAAGQGSALIRPRLEGVKVGDNYAVIYSPYGLAGGWEMSQTPYADGYEAAAALKLGQNILLYAITQ